MQVGNKKNSVLIFTHIFFFFVSGIAVCSSTMHKVVLVLSLALKICAGMLKNILSFYLFFFRLMISSFNYAIVITLFQKRQMKSQLNSVLNLILFCVILFFNLKFKKQICENNINLTQMWLSL